MSVTLRPARPEDADVISETLQLGFDGYREFAPPGWRPPDARSGPRSPACARDCSSPRRGRWSPTTGRWSPATPATSRSPAPPGARTCGSCSCARRGGASGVAVALLEAALAAADAEGYRRMRFFTPRDQARARAFYEREGFVATGWEAFEEAIGLVLVEYARELT